ncbi:RNA-binding protein [Massilia sp. W12]|uniref:vWA domain-containing protein n=1 Tax=Massilia sp. W12 TaxID=3126507 RepID=UPI0030CCE4A1
MANTTLFQSAKQAVINAVMSKNHEQAPAYKLSDKHQLAQFAMTGCLGDTFYADAQTQLSDVLALCENLDAGYIARTAIYCRERGYMKDMPALLTAVLAARSAEQLKPVFARVIDNGKMLRNFVQILRSGATGRKSLGTRPKKLVQQWLNTASEQALLSAAVGNAPSLADVVKMVHPKPTEAWREAFFAWLIGRPFQIEALPPALRAFELYKQGQRESIPQVPFQMLTSLNMGANEWAAVARQGGWQMVRMNLNTFARHGVFQVEGMTQIIADKLRDPQAIAKARVFPYQLLAAYVMADGNVPGEVREALQDAMEIALLNVPQFEGRVVVCPDISGSMHSSVSGYRAVASKVRCIDVAGLMSAALLRSNRQARVIPFAEEVRQIDLNPRDSVMTNAQKLANTPGGGTNCSAPLAQLNREKAQADLVIYVSDNESWVDVRGHNSTGMMREWTEFKKRNPAAKLVCIDITPNATTQAAEAKDILNIGGFSDDVFKLIASFTAGQMGAAHWVGEIEAIAL